MNKDFTLTLDSDMFTMEFSTRKNRTEVELYAEFCYTYECPTYDFEQELTPEEAEQITPAKAAALFSLIANLATQDIAAEAEFEALLQEDGAGGDSDEDTPVYLSEFDTMLRAMVHSFLCWRCHGEAG